MREETEIKSLAEVSVMAVQSLNPEEYEKYCEVYNILIERRSIPLPILGKKLLWQCKYCGENEKAECHKCVREDGLVVSDEL